MAYFNPPPNWPLPDDFEPGPTWEPNPNWGPVPYGWSLWIDDAGNPAGTKRAPEPTNAFGGPFGTLQVPEVADGQVSGATVRRAFLALALVLAVIGGIIEAQPVSLITGSGTLYTGLALAVAAVILASVVKQSIGVRLLLWLVAAFCVANVVYVSHQMTLRRDEIRNDLNKLGTTLQQFSAPPSALPCSTNPGFGCDASK